LTPDEIAARQFLVQLRGYDRDEVTAFLGRLAQEFGELRTRVDDLTADLEAARAGQESTASAAAPAPSSFFAEIGQQTARILEAANEAGAELQRRAREQADAELADARTRAADLVSEGERRRAAVEEQVSSLASSRDRLAGDLRGIGRTVTEALRAIGAGSNGEPPAIGSEGSGEPPAPAGRTVVEAPAPAPAPAPASDRDTRRRPDAVDGPDVEVPGAREAALAALRPPQGGEEGTASNVGDRGAAANGAPSTPTAGATGSPAQQVLAVAGDGPSGSEPIAQRLRSEALAPLHPKFVRRLVRGLGELQQWSLDRLAGGSAERAVPGAAELRGLAELSADYLDTAFASGTDAAEALAGASLPSPETIPPLADDFAAGLGKRVVDRLREVLAGGAGADALAAGVAAAYDELKGGAAEPLAAEALITAYEAGLAETLRAGGLDPEAVLAGSG